MQAMQDDVRIIAINLGSTSTKIAYSVNGDIQVKESIAHDAEELAACGSDIWAQYDLRERAVLAFMEAHGIALDELDAISSRGANIEPTVGGTYRINQAMRAESRSCQWGTHVSHLGVEIAFRLAGRSDHAVPVTTDLPTTDEFEPLAHYSGLAEIQRESKLQVLNHRAMARAYAKSIDRPYEELNLVVVMMGGGVTVASHCKGRLIDAQDGLGGDGSFSNNRCCGLPVEALVRLCYESGRTEEEMLRHINGEGGLMSYVDTTDIRELVARAGAGDSQVAEVLAAMCYQVAKDIGAHATVLKGKVDAILLVGGMANAAYLTDMIRERVEFIAPVVIMPGEREMESLCENAYLAVSGQIELKEFEPCASVPEWVW